MINYIIADIECLEDYFSLQVKTSLDSEVTIYECRTLQDCTLLYNYLLSINLPMYFYSINYDKLMLSAFCKLYEMQDQNILQNLRAISNYSIKGVDFKELRSNFWKLFFSHSHTDFKAHYEQTLREYSLSLNQLDRSFNDQFGYLYTQSKVYKELNIIEIPRALNYINTNKDGKVKPSISLKHLQLVDEGYNQKFDFSYTRIKDIENDGKLEEFLQYSKNDITSLEKQFLKKRLQDINIRLAAIKAVKLINPDFTYTEDMVYSENNTKLINHMFKIDNKQPIIIDYYNNINTNYQEFNNFVYHVSLLQHVASDKEIKDLWDKPSTLNVRGINIEYGLGGLHGDCGNIELTNLLHLDYTAQYPSTILQYKEYFANIMNVSLYEAVYQMRLEIKRKEVLTDEDRLIEQGLKLMLNSTYGLINSNFNLDISNKSLGRFITLKGQSLLLNLIDKLPEDVKLINVNTDGIIHEYFENVNEIIELDKDGYYTLGLTNIDYILQRDVNNYICKANGKWKQKGVFNPSIKQKINTNEKISVNLDNAIRLIKGKEIKLEPIYFRSTKFRDIEDKAYYFATNHPILNNAKEIIKDTVKPEKLGIDSEVFYFTTNLIEADPSLYKKYAELTKQQLLTHTYTTNKEKILHYDVILQPDTNENNAEIRATKRILSKLFESRNLGLTGYKNNLKKDSYCNRSPIAPLKCYTMSQIQNSQHCKGVSLYANSTYLIVDIDVYDKTTQKAKQGWQVIQPFLSELKEKDTFECWNRLTERFNRKFIFKATDFKLKDEYKPYIEIVEKAVLWTVDIHSNKYDCNFKEIKELY